MAETGYLASMNKLHADQEDYGKLDLAILLHAPISKINKLIEDPTFPKPYKRPMKFSRTLKSGKIYLRTRNIDRWDKELMHAWKAEHWAETHSDRQISEMAC